MHCRRSNKNIKINLQNEKELGINHPQLAEMAEMSVRSLSDYEKGHKNIMKINIVTACKLARALGYGMDDFVEALYSQNE